MARTRNIKPAFFDNDVLGDLTPLTRLLFIGLWCIADRSGRLEDRPRKIKKAILGYDDVTVEEASGMLQQLADSGFIIRYTAEGEDYIQIVNFAKHQNPHMKEKFSEIPPPPGFEQQAQGRHCTSTVQAPDTDDAEPTPPPLSDGESQPSVQQMRFNQFWAIYPNKKAKQTALKSWKKLNPNAALFEKIMKAVELQKHCEEWRKEGGRFIPHPATWINGGRWEDDVKEVRDSGKDGQSISGSNVCSGLQSRQSGTPSGFKSE